MLTDAGATSSSGPEGRPALARGSADECGVQQDAAAQGGREHLGLGPGAGAHGDEGEPEDESRAGHQASGAADPLDDGLVCRAVRSFDSRIRLMMNTW